MLLPNNIYIQSDHETSIKKEVLVSTTGIILYRKLP